MPFLFVKGGMSLKLIPLIQEYGMEGGYEGGVHQRTELIF